MSGQVDEILSPLLRNTLEQKRRADLQNTGDYGPSLGEMYGTFLGLPGLRGLWYPGDADDTGAVYDISGQGRKLTYNGNPFIALQNSLVPYFAFDGTGDFLSRPDEAGLKVIGNEGYVAAALRGLTIGGWFWADSLAASPVLISKYTAAGNLRSYKLDISSSAVRMIVSGTGADAFVATTGAIAAANWYFVVGRYTPSTAVAAFVNNNQSTFTTTIPATLFNTTAAFQIAASDAGTNLLTGRFGLAFLCAAALPNALLTYLFARTRALFGV